MSRIRGLTIGCASIFVIPLCVLCVSCVRYMREAEAQRIPSGLSIVARTYDYEKNYGFGPSGNETGVAVYRLDFKSAAKLRAFSARPFNSDRFRLVVGLNKWTPDNWKSTPLRLSQGREPWHLPAEERQKPLSVDIEDYLNRYGFGLKIDPAVRLRINKRLSTPGSFFTYGPGGTLTIISPGSDELFFVYAG